MWEVLYKLFGKIKPEPVPHFKDQDEVRIKSGFYEGKTGRITDKYWDGDYYVSFYGDYRGKFISPKNLELLGGSNED